MNQVAAAGLVLLFVTPPAPALAEDARPHPDQSGGAVTVRIYAGQERDIPAPVALDLAASLLRSVGLETRWLSCGTSNPDRLCLRPVDADELSMRLVHEVAGQDTGGVLPIGHSLVDTARRTGVLATLFLDRIERIARAAGVSPAVVTARAAAHEIAHLILGTNEHGDTGLMRALWSQDMLRFDAEREWVFTADEGRRLRLALASRRRGTEPAASTAHLDQRFARD